jgi:putative hydroxymethylpyrimidine transport system substrate-binding protein
MTKSNTLLNEPPRKVTVHQKVHTHPMCNIGGSFLAIVASLWIGHAAAADKVTVILDWFVNPDHAPLVIAIEAGFFERAGLDVELIAPADASTPPKLVAAGQADIAITYQPDLMLQIKEGLPLVRFGTLIDSPLNCLIVLKDGPVKSLADLKGKKIGFSVAGFQEAYLSQMLDSAGLKMSDISLIDVNFNLVTALKSRQVDAIVGGFRNFELIELELDGMPGLAFFPEEHGVPPYDELIFATRREMAGDPRLPRFLSAVAEATKFLRERPDEALGIFLKSHPDLNDELNRRAFVATMPRFAKNPATLDSVRYQHFAEFLKERGLIDVVPPLDTYAIEPK